MKVKSVRKKLEVTILERGGKRETKEEGGKFSAVKEVVSDFGSRLEVIDSLFEEVEDGWEKGREEVGKRKAETDKEKVVKVRKRAKVRNVIVVGAWRGSN